MQPWWERKKYEGWLEYELEELNRCPGVTEVGDAVKANGRVTIPLKFQYNEEIIDFMVVLPVDYPSFPPEIVTPGRKMYRHRGHTPEHMCFLGHGANGDHGWEPRQDTIAKMFKVQVPEALRISGLVECGELTLEQVEGREVHVGEPLSAFLTGGMQGGIFVNDYDIPAEATHGIFKWSLMDVAQNALGVRIRGVLIYPQDQNNKPLPCIDTPWKPHVPVQKPRRALWVRSTPPQDIERDKLWAWFMANHNAEATAALRAAAQGEGEVGLVSVVLDEEIEHFEQGCSWIFFAAVNIRGKIENLVLPGLRISRKEMDLRVPELTPLREKKVLIIGLGSIGSPIAVQLAKSYIGEIRLIDKDYISPGNIVRWAYGMPVVGMHKVFALQEVLSAFYPAVKIDGAHMAIGDPNATLEHIQALHEWVGEVDLVIDATASIEVNEYVAGICQEESTPYMWLSTTEGAWGGIIGRLMCSNSDLI